MSETYSFFQCFLKPTPRQISPPGKNSCFVGVKHQFTLPGQKRREQPCRQFTIFTMTSDAFAAATQYLRLKVLLLWRARRP